MNPTLVPGGVTSDTGCGGRPDTGDSSGDGVASRKGDIREAS